MGKRTANGVRRILGVLAHWAPVWVPLALLAQVGLLGLRPALTERARLEREATRVHARHDGARDHFETLDAEVKAWADPIYRERLRRLRRR